MSFYNPNEDAYLVIIAWGVLLVVAVIVNAC